MTMTSLSVSKPKNSYSHSRFESSSECFLSFYILLSFEPKLLNMGDFTENVTKFAIVINMGCHPMFQS